MMASFRFSSFICIAVLSCLFLAEPGYGWFLCPKGWKFNNWRCFKYFPRALTWNAAEKCCVNFGGHLASVHSGNDHRFLKVLQRGSGHRNIAFWIGLSGIHKKGKWIWSDGRAVWFTKWNSGEPNNAGGKEHCVHSNFGDQKDWNDIPCDHVYPFICAKGLFGFFH